MPPKVTYLHPTLSCMNSHYSPCIVDWQAYRLPLKWKISIVCVVDWDRGPRVSLAGDFSWIEIDVSIIVATCLLSQILWNNDSCSVEALTRDRDLVSTQGSSLGQTSRRQTRADIKKKNPDAFRPEQDKCILYSLRSKL